MHFKTNVICRKRYIGETYDYSRVFVKVDAVIIGCAIIFNKEYWINFNNKTEKCKKEIQRDWNLRKEYMALKKLISNAESKKEKRRI